MRPWDRYCAAKEDCYAFQYQQVGLSIIMQDMYLWVVIGFDHWQFVTTTCTIIQVLNTGADPDILFRGSTCSQIVIHIQITKASIILSVKVITHQGRSKQFWIGPVRKWVQFQTGSGCVSDRKWACLAAAWNKILLSLWQKSIVLIPIPQCYYFPDMIMR